MALDLPYPDIEGPFSKSLRSANSLRDEMALRRINEIKAHYEEPTLRSAIESKNAYSQFVAPQMLAHVLGGPAASQMNPQQYNQYVQQMANMLNQRPGQSGQNGMPAPMPQSFGTRIMNALAEKIAPEQQESKQPQNSLLNMPQQEQQQGNALSPPVQQVGGKTPSTTFSGLPLPDRQAELNYAYNKNGSNEPNNQSPQYNTIEQQRLAEKSAQKVKEREEIKKNDYFQKEWHDSNEESKNAAKIYGESDNDIDILERNYPKASQLEKGPVFGGRAEPFTEGGKAAKLAINRLIKSNALAISSKRITRAQGDIAKSLIPGMDQGPAGMQKAINYFKGQSIRSQEKSAFDAIAQDKGFRKHEADLMWNKYINDKPFYNAETGKIIGKNLGDYDQYLTEDALEKSKHIKSKVPEERILKAEAAKKAKNAKNGKRIHIRNKETGKEGYIPFDRLEAYEANGYEKV